MTSKITYLAVMPRERKPRAVGAVQAGWYREHARRFYEAPGLSAAEARVAIAAGKLAPTWVDGKPAGVELPEGAVATLRELFERADVWLTDPVMAGLRSARLWIGPFRYIPIRSHAGQRYKHTWHRSDTGVTYIEAALTSGDLDNYARHGALSPRVADRARPGSLHVRVDLMTEDYAHGSRDCDAGRMWSVTHELHLARRLIPADVAGV